MNNDKRPPFPPRGARPGGIHPRPARPGVAPRPVISPARSVALDALLDVSRSGAYAALALDNRIARARISDPDRRLASELTYGTLEKRLYIDWLLSKYMERIPDDAALREVLRMTVYQILFLDRVPDDAACSQAADMLRARGLLGLGPLCFAVLKRIAREKDALPQIPREDEAEWLSLTYSVPAWIIEKLIAQHGADKTQAFLNHRAPHGTTTVYLNPLRAGNTDPIAELGPADPSCAVPGCFRVRGDAARSEAFHNGLIGVQGEASQLCARLTAASRGQRVLDVCAAQGGKACYMALMMGGTGRVYAWDIHEHRVELIAKTARRLGLENVRPAVWDATREKPELVATMDAVLVDAPCSGLGMMHEKPDLRYRVKPENITALSSMQSELLCRAAAYVKPGGVLVYATCTLFDEENQQIIEGFLNERKNFAPDWDGTPLPEAWQNALDPERGLLLWPQEAATDGFYMMRMKRSR